MLQGPLHSLLQGGLDILQAPHIRPAHTRQLERNLSESAGPHCSSGRLKVCQSDLGASRRPLRAAGTQEDAGAGTASEALQGSVWACRDAQPLHRMTSRVSHGSVACNSCRVMICFTAQPCIFGDHRAGPCVA